MLPQIQARAKDAKEPPQAGLKTAHLPGMLQHAEELKAEIISDGMPLSMIDLVTDDEALLSVLGITGIRMEEGEPDASVGSQQQNSFSG